MLAISRALMAGPKALLLDAPSLGLAPKPFDQIGDITAINAQGTPVALVEQSAAMALGGCRVRPDARGRPRYRRRKRWHRPTRSRATKAAPNFGVPLGYAIGEIWGQILKAACAKGDLTRDRIQAAVEAATAMSTDDLVPGLDFSHPG